MRKIIPLLVVGIFVLSGLGAVAGTDVSEEKLMSNNISFSKPILKNNQDSISIDITEANSFIMEQGKPMLPSYVKTFTFPIGTKIKDVNCIPKNVQTQRISNKLMTTPDVVQVGLLTSQSKNKPIEYITEIYPKQWFEYDVSCGLYQGDINIIVEVEIFPVKYNPETNSIDWANEVDIDISFEEPVKQQSSRDQYELIVIGPDEYSDELAPLITHKIGRGISAKFAGLTEVYGGTGRDNQEKIKYYIKDAIETWGTSNVLLVGSHTKLPVRETHIYIADVEPPDDEIFVSDLYYADIYDSENNFCSWDSNGNSVFGEYDWNNNFDDVDLHPDVYLGRLPAINGNQVTTVVNKIKTYENNPGYQQDWFTNLVVCGGDTSPGYETLEGEFINQKVIDMMDGFTATKLWVSNGKLTGYIPKTGVGYIKDSINSGCGFLDLSGHGNTNVWATHPEDQPQTWVPTPIGYFINSDVGSLSNGNKLPIVAVEACSTAKFNKDTNTFNWAFLHNSNGGGIATFGATGLGWGYVGDGISQGLIGKMGLDTFRAFRYDNSITVGEMWCNALERYIKPSMESLDYKTAEEWTLFGDPTLQIAEESNPPSKPNRPNGPVNGKVGTEYTFTTSATDPDGDKIYYQFDWGDGTTSGWVGPFNSGSTGSAKKTWNSQDTFEIKVAAKDIHGKISDWSDPLVVQIPRSKTANMNSIIFYLLENHPNLFPIFRALFGL